MKTGAQDYLVKGEFDGTTILRTIRHAIDRQSHRQRLATSTRDDDAPQTGLGLSITKVLVESHGGRIDFRTARGTGTTFFFDLPEWVRPKDEPASSKGRILVCEDDPRRMLLARPSLESFMSRMTRTLPVLFQRSSARLRK